LMEEAERMEQQVRAAALGEEGGAGAAAGALRGLPAGEARRILDSVASDLGAQAVELLRELALRPEGELAVHAAEALGSIRDASAAGALQRVSAESRDRAVTKAARRALHRLASRGFHPPASEPKGTVSERRPERRTDRAPVFGSYASFIDGAGHRAIWLALEGGGGLDLLTLLTGESEGILDAHVYETDRAAFRREVERVTRDDTFPWTEIPADYSRHLLEEAHALNAAKRRALPLDYLAWRERIGRPEERYDQPLVYRVINAAEVRWDPRHLDSSATLLELRPFMSWVLDEEELAEAIRERTVASRSGLVLAGANEEARDRLVVEGAIQRVFDPARRSLLKRRLEEAAYMLWRLDRGYQARQALAAALALEPPDRSLSDHPFVRGLVRLSLEVASETAEGQRTREVKPGVQLHLPY
jgi:hypothetical protein